jgi:penicillin-binding protein 1A
MGERPSPWTRGVVTLLAGAALVAASSLGAAAVALREAHYVHFNRDNLPDLGAFTRFEFPTIGYVNDRNGQPLIALAREYRAITRYDDIPPIVRDAILATEDKRFFFHDGVDRFSIPRVFGRVRFGAWRSRLTMSGWRDNPGGQAIFPQGGSTITQQLVRGVFLQGRTSRENSYDLRNVGLRPRLLSAVIGARNVNMVLRKREETRLSLWLEQQMREQYGSRERAKKEILARYATFVYMGNGQYGFARAAEHYFGQPLSSLTAEDADKAALLASIPKAPRDYAPDASNTESILRRRNQTLALMAANGFISDDQVATARQRPLPIRASAPPAAFASSAVVAHVLDELTVTHPELGVEDLLQGRLRVDSTVDARIQRIVNEALRHGLERYEARHPAAVGLAQGAVVVLSNSDGSILAEVGGREVYGGRPTAYSDFNRVTEARRQPGSAMKPIVYLAAFLQRDFTLETLVPDEPISVPGARAGSRKWIENYDRRFKGLIPMREALAESRNAVAVWLASTIGIDRVLQTARSVGVVTPLQRYPTTALGASEVTLLELATAYRTIATGTLAPPHVIRQVVLRSGEVLSARPRAVPASIDPEALALIQEGLRSVVRMPTGTAHALNARAFPIAVMGKTGTTNAYRDAIFVGSTYGAEGVTVAVRIGFDDNRSLGSRETGGRVALPVFRDVMTALYRDDLVGPAPAFPPQMERRITESRERAAARAVAAAEDLAALEALLSVPLPSRARPPAESFWLLANPTLFGPAPKVAPLAPVRPPG